MSRRGGPRMRSAFGISALLHAGVLVFVWVASTRAAVIPKLRVYAVDIVSPPPQQSGEWSPEPATPEPLDAPQPDQPADDPAPQPEPEPQAPQPTPPARREPMATPAPTRKPDPPRQTPPAQKPTPPKQTPPAQQPTPTPAPSRPNTGVRPDPTSAGGENLDVRTEGAEFVDRAYLENIIRQVNRYFRRPAGSTTEEVELRFWINRDGSVDEIEVLRGGGSFRFRSAAMEAVEQAGINKAFGPLPRAYPADRLPVSFYFRPAR